MCSIPLTELRVIVDEREKPSGVPQELEGLDMMVNYEVLDVGDYLVQDCAIERKSVRDFVSSLFSGRLFDQAYRLGEAFQTPILVVEGDLDREMQSLRTPRSIWGGLISVVLDFRLACFFTKDQKQTAQFILTLAKGRRYKGTRSRPLRVRKPRTEDVHRVQRTIVESLPTIGPQMAEQLLTSFGSVRKAFAASVTEMAISASIGRSKALTINRILDAPYKASKAGRGQTQLR